MYHGTSETLIYLILLSGVIASTVYVCQKIIYLPPNWDSCTYLMNSHTQLIQLRPFQVKPSDLETTSDFCLLPSPCLSYYSDPYVMLHVPPHLLYPALFI